MLLREFNLSDSKWRMEKKDDISDLYLVNCDVFLFVIFVPVFDLLKIEGLNNTIT